MRKDTKQNFIKKFGQEIYFDKKITEEMIEREKNISYDTVSKFFEAILLIEFQNKYKFKIADLGAGAHSMNYANFIKFLKYNNGKIYWVDQSPFMLDYAQKNTPKEFKGVFEFKEKGMVDFLKEKKDRLDGIIFKYSFNYTIPYSMENILQIAYKSLKTGGKLFANLHFYEKEGMKERSYNAIYKIKGKEVTLGYKPKDNEIIEIEFLKKGGDKTDNPEVFAKTKIIYYSPKHIKEAALKAKFSEIRIFNDWQENRRWRDLFKQLNPNIKTKPSAFLYLCK